MTPPYPADTRAKGWRFEIDYEQVEQSTTWSRAKPEARPWLLMLWMLSWKQVPCGSLPDDHEAIAGLLNIPDELWQKHGASLLRGWWQADDGRLYHQTLTSRVLEMMARRRSDADRQAAKRARDLADAAGVTGESRVTTPDVTRESSTDHRILNTSTDLSELLTDRAARLPRQAAGGLSKFPPGFEEFWREYPLKKGKDDAIKAYAKRRFSPEQRVAVLDAVRRQKTWDDWLRDAGKYIPHPATWLNRACWEDEESGRGINEADALLITNRTVGARWSETQEKADAGS